MVLQLAKLRGWRTAHFRPAMLRSGKWVTAVQGDGKGFPDLILVRGAHIIAVELKVGRNKMTAEQIAWRDALVEAGVGFSLWTPDCWELIEEVLK